MDVIVSPRFVEALQRHPERAYRLWRRAGVDPTTGSKLLHGAALVRPNDPRILAVGRELGLAPDDCFETVPSSAPDLRERTAATA